MKLLAIILLLVISLTCKSQEVEKYRIDSIGKYKGNSVMLYTRDEYGLWSVRYVWVGYFRPRIKIGDYYKVNPPTHRIRHWYITLVKN